MPQIPLTDMPVSRRTLLGTLAAAPLAACAARNIPPTLAADLMSLTIYSPAPPNNPLHALNLQLLQAAAGNPALAGLEMIPVALPASINRIAAMGEERPAHLPIVTTVDFRPARAGTGPEWHGYSQANQGLKFVSTLYDIGFGIQPFDLAITEPAQLRGKRIAAPPRPSAVRLLTETLLRDGWGILDEVELVDMVPPQIAGAINEDAIDATSWNLVVPGQLGFVPMIPALPGVEAVRFLPVSEEALARINAANPFTSALHSLRAGDPPLISFAQALAAWDDGDPAQIRALLGWLADHGNAYSGFPDGVAVMRDWPDLQPEEVHSVAASFYEERGVGVV